MSYILDALRKSDQQRHRGATPTLNTAQSVPMPGKQRMPWRYATVAVAVATAAFALGWMRPWQTPARDAVPTTASSGEKPGDAAIVPRSVGTRSVNDTAASAPPAPESSPKASVPSVAENQRSPRVAPRVSEPASAAPAPATQPSSEKRDGRKADVKDTPENTRLPTLAELPASVRGELPPITITVHAYSAAPKERLLGVNNKFLREGEAVTPDLVLEQITPDGMILSYRGTRFRHGLR